VVNVYLELTFVVYALGDYWAWAHSIRLAHAEAGDTRLSMEDRIDLALKDHWGQFSPRKWVRWLGSKVFRHVEPLARLRAPKKEFLLYFEEFIEGKRSALTLALRITPIAMLRLNIDIGLPVILGASTCCWLVWRAIHL